MVRDRLIGNRLPRAVAAGAIAVVALAAWPQGAGAAARVAAASTKDGSELVETVPITKAAGAAAAVAYSLGPGDLPEIGVGDTLRTSAELQVSTTCVAPDARCIGHRYSYDPVFTAQIVLASSEAATSGPGTQPLTPVVDMACGQVRPNRNHHCVLTMPGTAKPILPTDQLPCTSGSCFLSLVVSAHNPNARNRDVLVIGNDQPDGTVKGGRGRLNAIVTRPGEDALAQAHGTTRRRSKTIPLGSQRSGFSAVAYSVRLDGLERGDVIAATARQNTGIGALSLPAFVGDQIILATKPTSLRPKRAFSSADGQLTPANGFNCTQGPSPYQTPCRSFKAGQVKVTRTPRDSFGLPKPLYVNLVTRAFPKVAQGKKEDTVRIRGAGYLNVVHYPR